MVGAGPLGTDVVGVVVVEGAESAGGRHARRGQGHEDDGDQREQWTTGHGDSVGRHGPSFEPRHFN